MQKHHLAAGVLTAYLFVMTGCAPESKTTTFRPEFPTSYSPAPASQPAHEAIAVSPSLRLAAEHLSPEHVKTWLTSPGSAQFVPEPIVAAWYFPGEDVTEVCIVGYLDAQNQIGVLTRGEYAVLWKFQGRAVALDEQAAPFLIMASRYFRESGDSDRLRQARVGIDESCSYALARLRIITGAASVDMVESLGDHRLQLITDPQHGDSGSGK